MVNFKELLCDKTTKLLVYLIIVFASFLLFDTIIEKLMALTFFVAGFVWSFITSKCNVNKELEVKNGV